MTIRQVLEYPHPKLSQSAEMVTVFDEALSQLVTDLVDTARAHQAEGLAATQIGEMKHVFVVKDHTKGATGYLAFVNASITQTHNEVDSSEGCLSFPGVFEKVKRSETVGVSYQDVSGEQLFSYYSEITAVAIQHELDHLKGLTFLSHMGKVQRHLALKKMAKTQRHTAQLAARIQKQIARTILPARM